MSDRRQVTGLQRGLVDSIYEYNSEQQILDALYEVEIGPWIPVGLVGKLTGERVARDGTVLLTLTILAGTRARTLVHEIGSKQLRGDPEQVAETLRDAAQRLVAKFAGSSRVDGSQLLDNLILEQETRREDDRLGQAIGELERAVDKPV